MAGARGRAAQGITLIEVLVALAIASILAAVSIAALSDWADAARLRGAATVLSTDLRLAQTEAQKRQTRVAVTFATDDWGGWCYGWQLDSPCNCRQAAQCLVEGVPRVVTSPDWPGIRLAPGVAGNTFTFNPRRGTVTAGHVTLHSDSGHAIRVVVHGMGRIRLCRPAHHPPLAGLPTC